MTPNQQYTFRNETPKQMVNSLKQDPAAFRALMDTLNHQDVLQPKGLRLREIVT